MNTVCEKDMCYGCNACVSICPKNCITIEDGVSALNAVKDLNKCINCGLCSKVCQVNDNKVLDYNSPIKTLEGYSLSDDLFRNSTSGGFATTLAIEFINNGGYVVGVNATNGKPKFEFTNDVKFVKMFAGSKYVKIDTGNIYSSIKQRLNENKVLFFGTPCQVAGLKLYLRRDYDNLYCIELICHGTPSYKVLDKYLNENNIDNYDEISFRYKNNYIISIDKKPMNKELVLDDYSIGFLNSLFLTNNCYNCQYAKNDRIADITIGDSWGTINKELMVKGKSSLILIQSNKGLELKEMLEGKFAFYERCFNDAAEHNHQLKHPSIKKKQTDYFFKNFDKYSFKKLIKKCLPKEYYKQQIKKILIVLGIKK